MTCLETMKRSTSAVHVISYFQVAKPGSLIAGVNQHVKFDAVGALEFPLKANPDEIYQPAVALLS